MEAGFLRGALLALLLLAAGPVAAELGGDAASIAGAGGPARAPLAAVQRTDADARFTVFESELATGTRVREYLSPAGKVFAVAWQGPQMPDLERLFGAHFTAYRQLAAARRPVHGPLAVAGSDLVVQSGGRMRAFFGRAYLVPLVPAGVSIDEIK